MKLINKVNPSNSIKLNELMKAVDGTCSIKEKKEANKIFKIYLNRSEVIK